MGARTFISGMKPDIALTLETMGVELKGVMTTLDLEGALQLLGVRSPDREDTDGEADDDVPPAQIFAANQASTSTGSAK